MPHKVERNIKIPQRLRRMAWEATDTFRQEKDFGLSAVTSGDNIYAINLKGYGAKSKVVELMRKADLVSDAAQQEAKKRTARRQIELMESQFRAGTSPP